MISENTPDIRAVFHTLTTHKKPFNETYHDSTLSTLTADDMSSVASGVLADEKLQLDTALRNSMKESFEKSVFTPEGDHIDNLRAKRKLFKEADHSAYRDSKRAAIDYDLSNDPDSPPVLDQKSRNRLNNNGLDMAYFMSTQASTPSPMISSARKVSTVKGSKWLKDIRLESMRHMRCEDDEVKATKGRALYRLLTRKQPTDEYGDIMSIANDSDEMGMTVEDTVKLMISMM